MLSKMSLFFFVLIDLFLNTAILLEMLFARLTHYLADKNSSFTFSITKVTVYSFKRHIVAKKRDLA